MAAIKQLAAVTRSGTGKGAARSVRREGRVPGVIYGGGEKAEPISVDFKELNKLIYAGQFLTTIFELDIERPQGAGAAARLSARRRHRQADARRFPPPQGRVRACASPCPCMWSTAKLRRASRRAARSISCCIRRAARAGRRDPGSDHRRPHRPRLPRFGACLRAQTAGRLPSRRHHDRFHRRDGRAADRLSPKRRRAAAATTAAAPARPLPPRARHAARRWRCGPGRRRCRRRPGQGRAPPRRPSRPPRSNAPASRRALNASGPSAIAGGRAFFMASRS